MMPWLTALWLRWKLVLLAVGGALATICPDDKKLLHGMRDAILAPASGLISR